MDVVYVRTKLQATILGELLKSGEIRQSFVLIKQHRLAEDEDDRTVYASYSRLERAAFFSTSEVESRGFVRSFLLGLLVCVAAAFTRGTVYTANIRHHPLAFALRCLPSVNLKTLDDGFANISPGQSPYFIRTPLEGEGFKRKLLRVVFPYGVALFMRNRSRQHFTIYQRPNIVDVDRLCFIRFEWECFLTDDDRQRLSSNPRTILIGTKYEEWPAELNILARILELSHKVDAYLPHPRESFVVFPDKAIRLDAPAEAAIAYLMREGPLVVYHLDSSVAFAFEGVDNVTFHNIAPKGWLLSEQGQVQDRDRDGLAGHGEDI